jgi:hypothetical protein
VTPQEQQLLTSLAQRVNQTQLQEKDPDAENLLGRELGANSDAIYILAQTVLVQNIALEQAKAQVAQLQQQLQQSRQPAHSTSFLGRLLGDRDTPAAAPQPPQYQPVPQQYNQPQYAPPPPQYQQPPYQQPQYVPVQGGQPSFLRGAMQTAAGVAAGALAFEGVESVLHGLGGYGHPGMGMGGFGMDPAMGMGGGFGRPVEETVVNNYYDQPGTQGFDNDRGGEMHHEASDQNAAFSDPGYANNDSGNNAGNDSGSGDDQTGFDDSSAGDATNSDNAGMDDTAGFDGGQDDGGGGFDDGGGFGGDGGSDLV